MATSATEYAHAGSKADAMAWAVWLIDRQRWFEYRPTHGPGHLFTIDSDDQERPPNWPLPQLTKEG